jgi:sugar lactone lactonase YvrE
MLGGEDGQTLYIVAAEWGGSANIGAGARTGVLYATEAPAPHAGWP